MVNISLSYIPFSLLTTADRTVLMKAGVSQSSLPHHLMMAATDGQAGTYEPSNNWTLPNNDEMKLLFTQVYEHDEINGSKKFHLGLFFDAAMNLQESLIPAMDKLAHAVWKRCSKDEKKQIFAWAKDNEKLSITTFIGPRVKAVLNHQKVAAITQTVITAILTPEVTEYLCAHSSDFNVS